MKDYYSILEIPKNVSKAGIKKAYFRMVRKYPPDRLPEDFKRVREAYEVLIDENTRREYDSIDSMPDIVKVYFNSGKKAMEEGDYEQAVKVLKEVTRVYPDFTVLNSLLGDACLENGNSGNAIQIFRRLTEQNPENASFAGKLAHAYLERGWHKKAIQQYEIALALDEDNLSLWDGLVNAHFDDDNEEQAIQTARDAIEVSKQNQWDSLPIYINLIQLELMSGNFDDLKKDLEDMKIAAQEYEDNKENLGWFLETISKMLHQFGMTEIAAAAIETAHELLPEEKDIRDAMDEIQKENDIRQILDKLGNDEDFPFHYAAMIEYELNQIKGFVDNHDDKGFEEFVMEMEVIFDIQAERKHVRRLKEKYPELYSLKETFFNRVLNISQTKQLEREYGRKIRKYEKLYPEAFKSDEYEDEDEWYVPQEPVRREGPKIGRNDPCPCGSGKKYKRCCGA